MKLNIYIMFVVCAFLGVCIERTECAIPHPDANSRAWVKTERALALLRGPLAAYSQKLNLEAVAPKSDNKTLALVGVGADFVRMANEILAIYNAWVNGDLGCFGSGDQFLQFAGLTFIAEDLNSFLTRLAEFISTGSTDDLDDYLDDEDGDEDESSENIYETENEDNEHKVLDSDSENHAMVNPELKQKLSEFVTKLIVYVLPLAEGVASVGRAYASGCPRNNMGKNIRLLNYACFLIVNGSRMLSNFIVAEKGSWTQVVAVIRMVICATLFVMDSLVVFKNLFKEGIQILGVNTRELEKMKADLATANQIVTNLTLENRNIKSELKTVKTSNDSLNQELTNNKAEMVKLNGEMLTLAGVWCGADVHARKAAAEEFDALGLARINNEGLFDGSSGNRRKAAGADLILEELTRLIYVRNGFGAIWNKLKLNNSLPDESFAALGNEKISDFITRQNNTDRLNLLLVNITKKWNKRVPGSAYVAALAAIRQFIIDRRVALTAATTTTTTTIAI